MHNEEKAMLQIIGVNTWNTNIAGNKEVEVEVEFEKFVLSLSEFTNKDPGELSLFEFYSLENLLTEKYKKNGSDNKV